MSKVYGGFETRFKKGHKQPDYIKAKLSLAHKGKKYSEETKKKMSEAHKGQKRSKESRLKMSYMAKQRVINGNHNFWKGGINIINNGIRHSLEYKLWRESIFERDKYICVFCKQKGGKLNADHIKPFALFPELRFAIDNGRTLCGECHKKTNTFGINQWNNRLNKS
ncbi:MAG: HNH endonuclease [Nanoarchaeota archaeon]